MSATLRGLIRIYPLAQAATPPRWSVSTVPLERNPRDSRRESFKLHGDRAPGAHERINNVFAVTGEVPAPRRADLLAPYAVGGIDEANERRLSLAVVHPTGVDLEFEYNPTSPDSPQLALFDVDTTAPTAGAKRFAFIPRLRFNDGRDRCLMLRDWGVFELMRKHPDFAALGAGDRRSYMAGGLHLDSSCSLLVGNFNAHRNAWLVISVLRGLRAAPSLFDELVEPADDESRVAA
jgi:hypothetical protein